MHSFWLVMWACQNTLTILHSIFVCTIKWFPQSLHQNPWTSHEDRFNCSHQSSNNHTLQYRESFETVGMTATWRRQRTFIASGTQTAEWRHTIDTGGATGTGGAEAFINVIGTIYSSKTCSTVAQIPVKCKEQGQLMKCSLTPPLLHKS